MEYEKDENKENEVYNSQILQILEE